MLTIFCSWKTNFDQLSCGHVVSTKKVLNFFRSFLGMILFWQKCEISRIVLLFKYCFYNGFWICCRVLHHCIDINSISHILRYISCKNDTILFGTSQRLKSVPSLTLVILADSNIQLSANIKILGATLDFSRWDLTLRHYQNPVFITFAPSDKSAHPWTIPLSFQSPWP